MNCKQTQSSFDERLDGRLDAARQAQFEAHVASCSACRAQWQAYAAAWQTLARHEAIAPSFGFAARTLRRLEQPAVEPRPLLWRLPVFRWAMLAGVVVVAGLGGSMSWQHMQDRHRAEIYVHAHQDMLEDFDVIAALDDLNGENEL